MLSGGRLRLGVGIGWNHVEYEALGENFHNRGRRIEEQIALMRRLWTEELVDFDGKYHSMHQAGISPLPVQRPIPIWMGGGADAVLRRIAKIADGWFPQFQPGPQARGDRRDAPRLRPRSGPRARRRSASRGGSACYNTPEDKWDERCNGWRDLGATHVSFNTMGAGLASPQRHIEVFRRFKERGDLSDALAPDVASLLGAHGVAGKETPVAHNGFSGARISTIDNGGQRYWLKRLRLADDWIMQALEDTHAVKLSSPSHRSRAGCRTGIATPTLGAVT